MAVSPFRSRFGASGACASRLLAKHVAMYLFRLSPNLLRGKKSRSQSLSWQSSTIVRIGLAGAHVQPVLGNKLRPFRVSSFESLCSKGEEASRLEAGPVAQLARAHP